MALRIKPSYPSLRKGRGRRGRKGVAKSSASVQEVMDNAVEVLSEPARRFGPTIVESLPPEFQQVWREGDMDTKAVMVTLSLAAPSAFMLALKAAFYEESVSANEAAKLLDQGKAFLVDVRSEEERARDGVPDLRRDARGRAAVVEVQQLDRPDRAKLRDPGNVERKLAAARAIESSRAREGLVVMGGRNARDASRVANEIRNLGRKAAILRGGFRAWESSGLRVASREVYDVNPVEGFATDTIEGVSRDPATTFRRVGIAGLAAFAIYNYEPILQVAAFWGVLLSAVDFASKFDSPDEALEAISVNISKLSSSLRKVGSPLAQLPAARRPDSSSSS